MKNVQTWEGLDIKTTNDDYSHDIIARAQRLISPHGWVCGKDLYITCPRILSIIIFFAYLNFLVEKHCEL